MPKTKKIIGIALIMGLSLLTAYSFVIKRPDMKDVYVETVLYPNETLNMTLNQNIHHIWFRIHQITDYIDDSGIQANLSFFLESSTGFVYAKQTTTDNSLELNVDLNYDSTTIQNDMTYFRIRPYDFWNHSNSIPLHIYFGIRYFEWDVVILGLSGVLITILIGIVVKMLLIGKNPAVAPNPALDPNAPTYRP